MIWKLTTNDYKVSVITATVVACEKKKTFFLSLKKLILFWLAATFSVLIPVLHFILVPAFLGLGVFTFFNQYKNKFFFEKAECQCPQCLQKFFLNNFYFFDGKKIGCTLCMAQLRIEHD